MIAYNIRIVAKRITPEKVTIVASDELLIGEEDINPDGTGVRSIMVGAIVGIRVATVGSRVRKIEDGELEGANELELGDANEMPDVAVSEGTLEAMWLLGDADEAKGDLLGTIEGTPEGLLEVAIEGALLGGTATLKAKTSPAISVKNKVEPSEV